MSRVIVSEFLSLDGVMQAPGDKDEDPSGGFEHGGWQLALFDEAIGEFVIAGLQSGGGLLLGRRTYDVFAAYWPNQPADDPIAQPINALPKYVASTTLQEPLPWENSHVIDDVPSGVAKLKEQPGGDLRVIGSGELVKSLVEHDLVDRYDLMVYPLLLGGGKRLFPDGKMKVPLRLVDSRTTPNGVVILQYEPARDSRGGEAQ
jgi:dihydrofolate reductase